MPPFVAVFNRREIWRKLSLTLHFRLESRAATNVFASWGETFFAALRHRAVSPPRRRRFAHMDTHILHFYRLDFRHRRPPPLRRSMDTNLYLPAADCSTTRVG